MRNRRSRFVAIVALAAAGCTSNAPKNPSEESMTALARKIARFSPTPIGADTASLSPGDRQALVKIVEAARLLDPLFLDQVWSGNRALDAKLAADTTPAGRERFHYFRINKGPWSRLDENEAFVEGVPAKPAGAGFYPDGMAKAEFEKWEAGLVPAAKDAAQSFFTVIRRDSTGSLTAVPYSEAYKEFLEPAGRLLREAASLTSNATLRRFLTLRAEAFEKNDYYASDVAWMELDAPIDVTFGPYETYEDEMFGYKTAFEAYVGLRDAAESDKLARFSSYLQELENNLPFDPKHRNPKLGAAAPIRVVDVVLTSGDGNRGVQTAAFNLPNDERVIKEKGSKRVMLKNVQQAKFEKTLIPISRIVLGEADQANVSFDAFFTHVLAHELMHGLGPHNIVAGGRKSTVRLELKDLYSAIEEAKADATGLWALRYLMHAGKLDEAQRPVFYTTFLASMFRSVRFGINEAHGKGVALQFHYLLEKGGIEAKPDGTFAVDMARFEAGVTDLTRELLTLEAEGDYAAAKAMLDKYGVISPPMRAALDKLTAVPVDIEPAYAPLTAGN
ncbi:MAG: hypothetical protein R2729_30535 [Bryobacteraceae bacterium]